MEDVGGVYLLGRRVACCVGSLCVFVSVYASVKEP